MTSGGKRFATTAAEVTVPEVRRIRRLRSRSRSIKAAAARTSPTLAPWIQTSGPCGRTSWLKPRRSPTRAGSSLPCFSRRLISAGASGTRPEDRRRYIRSVIGSELAMVRFRAAELGIGAASCFVQRVFQLLPQRFHGGGVGVRRDVDFLDSHQCAFPKWQIDGGAVPVLEPDVATGGH